jgi:hypothetical protein
MYYICKFSGTWLVYDGNTQLSQILPPAQVETIRQLFGAALNQAAVLDALMLSPVSASKLQQPASSAYFICRFASTWSLYNGYSKSSELLRPADIEAITTLFPSACKDSLILDVLMIAPIAAGRLQALTSAVPTTPLKKII